MEFYYENHRGQRIDFFNSPYILAEHTFTDWNMTYQLVQRRSTGFAFDPATKTFRIRLMPRAVEAADREEAYRNLYDEFVSVISQDIEQPGKLWTTNGEYMVCRIIEAAKSAWNKYRDVTIACVLLADNPVWIKEVIYEKESRGESEEDPFLDYPYDYPYDYASGQTGSFKISNKGYGAANYRLIIYGPAASPNIVLDNVVIGADTILQQGEYLVIDSQTHSVYTVQNNGTIVNQFNNRSKTRSIFEKISRGEHLVVWNGTFGYDLILYEERREPEWN